MTVPGDESDGDQPRLPDCPYKGLIPFEEEDAAFFFGREVERELIVANLQAARLTVLYGPSGVGKSSALLAGAVHDLREETHRDLQQRGAPDHAVVVLRSWQDDPVASLIRRAREAVAQLVGEPAIPSDPRLDVALAACGQKLDGHLIVILDQFEEYFLYHGLERGEGTFDVEFPRVVNRPDLRVSFLISIREDAHAKLDVFKGRIPIFENYLRIDHLDASAARAACRGPIDEYNRRLRNGQVAIEPELVEQVVQQVQTGRIRTAEAGAGSLESDADGRVEAPFLQLVLRRLWDAERSDGSKTLRAGTLERLGGAEQIVRTRLDEAMAALPAAEQDIAARVFQFLVTPSGTKIAHTASDLAAFTELDEADVRGVLEKLAGGDARILRPIAPPENEAGGSRYEIFHDVLAAPVLGWRARWREAAAKRDAETRLREERQKSRIYRGVAVACVLVAAGVAVLAYIALEARDAARRDRRAARVANSAARANAYLSIDPARSIGPAATAFEADRRNRYLLLDALSRPRLDAVVRYAGQRVEVSDAALRPDGRKVFSVAADGSARISDARTGNTLHELTPFRLEGASGEPQQISVTRTGGALVTTGVSATLFAANGRRIGHFEGDSTPPILDPTGSAIVAQRNNVLQVFDATSGRLLKRSDNNPFGDATSLAIAARGDVLVSTNAGGEGPGTTVVTWSFDRKGTEAPKPLRWGPFLCGTFNSFDTSAVSPDGRLAAVGSDEGCVDVFDARGGRSIRRGPFKFRRPVKKLAFDPSGRLLAIAAGKTLTLWNRRTDELTRLRGHDDSLSDFDFRADGSLIATASDDGTAIVWDVGTALPLYRLLGHAGPLDAVDVGGIDDRTIATSSRDGTVRIWSLPEAREFRGHRDAVTTAVFAQRGDKERVLTAARDGAVWKWSVRTQKVTKRLGPAQVVQLAPDGRFFLTASDSGVELRFIGEPGPRRVYDGPASTASASPDGRRVAFLTADGVGLMTLRSGKFGPVALEAETTLKAEIAAKSLTGIAMAPVGMRFATFGSNDRVRLWSATRRSPTVLERQRDDVDSAAFSRDGHYLVTVSRDGTARVLDTHGDPEPEATLRLVTGGVATAAFNRDGRLVALGGTGGITTVWDWKHHRIVGVLRMHADVVNSVQFAPNSDMILTGSDDRTAKMYRCETCGLSDRQLLELARARASAVERALRR